MSVTGSVPLPMGQQRLAITLLNWIISAFFSWGLVFPEYQWVKGHETESTSLSWPDLCVNRTSWTLDHSAFQLLSLNFCSAALKMLLQCLVWTAQSEPSLLLAYGLRDLWAQNFLFLVDLQDFPKHCKSKTFAHLCCLNMELIPVVRWSCSTLYVCWGVIDSILGQIERKCRNSQFVVLLSVRYLLRPKRLEESTAEFACSCSVRFLSLCCIFPPNRNATACFFFCSKTEGDSCMKGNHSLYFYFDLLSW